MLGTRHEEYAKNIEGFPFLLNVNLNRNEIYYSKERNWHENLEIQLCEAGDGFVFLNSEQYKITKNDIVVVNSNVIHYTGSSTNLIYSCLIISTDFCRGIGINSNCLSFKPIIRSKKLFDLFILLKNTYLDHSIQYREAKLNKLLIELLIELAENSSVSKNNSEINSKKIELIKSVICYLRDNYNKKITLDEIAKTVLYDKYALCREFKKYMGKTIIEDLNNYRCLKAMDLLSSGHTVAETAELCGFDNFSYFSKTFKKFMGILPSVYKDNKKEAVSIY